MPFLTPAVRERERWDEGHLSLNHPCLLVFIQMLSKSGNKKTTITTNVLLFFFFFFFMHYLQ